MIKSILPTDPLAKEAKAVETEVFTERTANFDDTAAHRVVYIDENEGRVVASVSCFEYDTCFDGHIERLMGLGGVCTLESYRGRGIASENIEEALRISYGRGIALSYLYPVSTALYRRYGYAPGAERDFYNFKLEPLAVYRNMPGIYEVRLVGRPECEEIIKDLYKKAYSYNNLYSFDIPRYMDYNYIVFDGEKPMGCVSYTEEESDRKAMCGGALAYLDKTALCTVLAHLSKFTCRYERIFFESMPPSSDILGMVSESNHGKVTKERHQLGMVRALDAEKLLSHARTLCDGEATVRLTDRIIAENNGAFRLISDGGKTTVEKTDGAPDIEMDIEQFGALIIGRYDTEALRVMPGVTLHTDIEKLRFLFYKKPVYIDVEF